MPLLTCLWPGLSQLWLQGRGSGLLTAMAFAILLNGLLLAGIIWPELTETAVPSAGWLVVGFFWCAGAWRSWRGLPQLCGSQHSGVQEDLFLQSQVEYLKGHWFEAEALLKRLTGQRRDIDAQLMLATLYRHTGQWGEAQRQLALLERLEGAQKWSLEIHLERQQLQRQRDSQGDRPLQESRSTADEGEQREPSSRTSPNSVRNSEAA